MSEQTRKAAERAVNKYRAERAKRQRHQRRVVAMLIAEFDAELVVAVPAPTPPKQPPTPTTVQPPPQLFNPEYSS